MQPALVIIGLNHRMAPLAVRERFWMNRERRAEALATLSQAEGVEEVFVFSTCQRTEFVAWGDPTLAINSVLRFLSSKYDLKLSEWNSFYRLLDETALAHAFRVSCGLDSMSITEGHIARQANAAWQQARASGSTGPYLNAVLRRALAVRRRVLEQTAIGDQSKSAPHTAVEVAQEILGSLAKKSVVVFGAGSQGEISARGLADHGASVCVISHTDARTAQLASWLRVESSSVREWQQRLVAADLLVSSVSESRPLLTAAEFSEIAFQRSGRKLLLIDLAMPRSIDPDVRQLPGMILYDLDDLERAATRPAAVSESEVEAQRIILEEVQRFRREIVALDSSPAIAALRNRLDEICRQELESFRLERGPFPKDQDRLLAAVGNRITHRIAGSLSRELKGPLALRVTTA